MLKTLSIAALSCAVAFSIPAAESYSADAQSVEVPDAPFVLELHGARWLEDGDGPLALALDYTIHNQGGETLGSLGWTLAIEGEDGEPKLIVDRIASCDVAPGNAAEYTAVISGQRFAGAKLGDRITVAGTSSSTRRCGGSPIDCNALHFTCQQHCNNPLGTDRGIRNFECGNCRDWFDPQRQCWARTCDMVCECGDQIWPDQMPALEEFFDWDPVLEDFPGGPWPF